MSRIGPVAGVPDLSQTLSPAVKIPATASLVYLSGQVPADAAGLTEGSITKKTEVVIANLEKVLLASGSSLSQLIKVNVYIKELAFMPELNKAYERLVPDPKPARTCVTVKDLPMGADIEIEAVAWSSESAQL